MTIDLIRKIFSQIMKGMQALYSHRIIHRDLKLENILVKGHTIKISDFGFAKQMGNFSQVQSIKCGTPSTMAPEILFTGGNYTKYTNKCDIWSIGIILHEIAYGCHPFAHDIRFLENGRRIQVKNSIREIEDFLNKCLVLDPSKRMDWKEAFRHDLMSDSKKNGEKIQESILKRAELPSKPSITPRKYSALPQITSINNKMELKKIRNVKRKPETISFLLFSIEINDFLRILKILFFFLLILLWIGMKG